jgi:uncharacterized protein (TIGR03663 family)
MELPAQKRYSWLDYPIFNKIVLNGETIFWVALFILAVFSRFYNLGARVMSHDENSHVYYSWRFYKGQGFQHDPLMHGPLLFHLTAASFFMFGDNDFTARIPQAVCGVAMVMFMIYYRRYLGRAGSMVAGILMLISPYMLFYDRYARNEAFIGLFGVVFLWAILRYLETGEARFLYLATIANVLHFTSKETSFIYTAQALLFLACYFVYRISQVEWRRRGYRARFLIALIIVLLFVGAAGGYLILTRQPAAPTGSAPAIATVPHPELTPPPVNALPVPLLVFLILGGVALLAAAWYLIKGYGWDNLRRERSFGLLIVIGTLVLPQLSAFPVRLMGWEIPTNASEVMALTMKDVFHIGVFLVPIVLISVVIGLLWNPLEWLTNAAIWYGIFTVFYTSVFTNGAGFFTGMVGSLGYWLEQQGVNRGSQPFYYYALVQIPVYEYLPALGTWLAFAVVIWKGLKSFFRDREDDSGLVDALEYEQPEASLPEPSPVPIVVQEQPEMPDRPVDEAEEIGDDVEHSGDIEHRGDTEHRIEPGPFFALLGFWAVTSLLAFSAAGEKMPWLTVHITLPAILCAAWFLGRTIDATNWGLLREKHGWLALLVLPVFAVSLLASLSSLLGTEPPFQGKELVQLQATSQFLTSFIVAMISGAGWLVLVRRWPFAQHVRILTLFVFAGLGILTARTAIQASFYNYDYANELLVYAHSAPGVKIALNQIEEISRRTTDGLAIAVAYDNETSYPYWWYLRNYPQQQYYGANPSRTLREVPLILVGDTNFGKIEPVVANLYDEFDYIRLWWPNQDYYDLTWERIKNALLDPAMRNAVFQIWLNRDYIEYGKVTQHDMSLPNWSPAARMRLYIRKDIASKLWNYGSAPAPQGQAAAADPFEGKQIDLAANAIYGSAGIQPGQFQRPRDIAAAPDGTIYVVDTDNSRIQHLSAQGEVLQVWGTFADITKGDAPGGTFNQPWGSAVAPDGSVFVADTWNHRIQKFTSQGEFVKMWGYFGQAEKPEGFWGPRDVAVDGAGRVFVTDTGNKRVVIFTADGEYVTQFGSAGMGPGQFDEPVGITVDQAGLVYVADTWNQRIQVFQADDQGQYTPLRSWDLQAWYGQSLDNKPYMTVDTQGNLFVSDPEGYRILQFTLLGEPVRSWGDFGAESNHFAMPVGVTVDPQGDVWVVDSGNNRIMKFILPK